MLRESHENLSDPDFHIYEEMKKNNYSEAYSTNKIPASFSEHGYLLKEDVCACLRAGKIKNIPYIAGCVMDDLGTTDEDRAKQQPGVLLDECQEFCKEVQKACGTKAYCYLFSRELPGEDGCSDTAFHSAELWYMFGTLDRCWRPMKEYDYSLSREMITAWTNFMKTGESGAGWSPCSEAEDSFKIFR